MSIPDLKKHDPLGHHGRFIRTAPDETFFLSRKSSLSVLFTAKCTQSAQILRWAKTSTVSASVCVCLRFMVHLWRPLDQKTTFTTFTVRIERGRFIKFVLKRTQVPCAVWCLQKVICKKFSQLASTITCVMPSKICLLTRNKRRSWLMIVLLLSGWPHSSFHWDWRNCFPSPGLVLIGHQEFILGHDDDNKHHPALLWRTSIKLWWKDEFLQNETCFRFLVSVNCLRTEKGVWLASHSISAENRTSQARKTKCSESEFSGSTDVFFCCYDFIQTRFLFEKITVKIHQTRWSNIAVVRKLIVSFWAFQQMFVLCIFRVPFTFIKIGHRLSPVWVQGTKLQRNRPGRKQWCPVILASTVKASKHIFGST